MTGALRKASTLAVAAVAALVTFAPPASATTGGGHLYIAGNACNLWCASMPPSIVLRYPLHDGIPSAQPDARYEHLAGPLGLDAANHLYAFSLDGTHVVVFRPGSTSVERTIDLQPGYQPPPYAGLAVDATGTAYVAPLLDNDDSYYVPASPCGWLVAVYASDAQGAAKPLQCLPTTSAFSFALTAGGQFLESASPIGADAVFAFGTPKAAPYLARTIYGPSFAHPIATAQSAGELFVLNAPKGMNSFVAVYDAAASGSAAPLREIMPEPGRNGVWTGAIAVDATRLYVATGAMGTAGLLVFDRNANGAAKPLASLRVPGARITAVAVGL